MIEQEIVELIAVAKEASPYIWQVLVKQASATGTTYVVLSVVLLSVSVLLLTWMRYKPFFDEWEDVLSVFGVVFIIVSTILEFILMPIGIQMLYNPEYYALAMLLNALK